MKWISYMYTYIPLLLNLPSPAPCPGHLGHHRAPSWAPCAIQQVRTSYLFYTWQCTCVNPNLPIHLPHHPVSINPFPPFLSHNRNLLFLGAALTLTQVMNSVEDNQDFPALCFVSLPHLPVALWLGPGQGDQSGKSAEVGDRGPSEKHFFPDKRSEMTGTATFFSILLLWPWLYFYSCKGHFVTLRQPAWGKGQKNLEIPASA